MGTSCGKRLEEEGERVRTISLSEWTFFGLLCWRRAYEAEEVSEVCGGD